MKLLNFIAKQCHCAQIMTLKCLHFSYDCGGAMCISLDVFNQYLPPASQDRDVVESNPKAQNCIQAKRAEWCLAFSVLHLCDISVYFIVQIRLIKVGLRLIIWEEQVGGEQNTSIIESAV